MISWTSFFSSMIDVIIIGIIACMALGLAVWSRRSQRQDRTFGEFAANENGVSYSLGLAIVTPIYTLIMCVIIECALIMVVKVGTVHAAYAAARSAMVWMPSEVSWSKRKSIIKNAAVQAITPFATSREDIGRAAGITSQRDPIGNRNYYSAYRSFFNPDYSGFLAQRSFGKNSREYVYRKREYARKATQVEIKLEPYAHTAEVTARVAYEMPINTPGAGRVLGRIASFGGNIFTREVTTNVTLDLAMSTAKDGRIGIGYRPDGIAFGGSFADFRPERPPLTGNGGSLDPFPDANGNGNGVETNGNNEVSPDDDDLGQGRPADPIEPIPDPLNGGSGQNGNGSTTPGGSNPPCKIPTGKPKNEIVLWQGYNSGSSVLADDDDMAQALADLRGADIEPLNPATSTTNTLSNTSIRLEGYDKVTVNVHGIGRNLPSPKDLADYLKAQGFKGETVELVICGAGGSRPGRVNYAQKVANELPGVTVLAYDQQVTILSGIGRIYDLVRPAGTVFGTIDGSRVKPKPFCVNSSSSASSGTNGSESGNRTSAESQPLKEQVQAESGSERELGDLDCSGLAQQKGEIADAQTKAKLANAAYQEPGQQDLPQGWSPATDDDLRSLGLMNANGTKLTEIPGSDFRSYVFKGPDGRYVVAFKGTTITSAEDIENNKNQFLGKPSVYYERALRIADQINKYQPGTVEYVGHSLGGGMASAAAAKYGAPATTYNAAGLNDETLLRTGVTPSSVNTDAYYVEGEIVSGLQDRIEFAPQAAGERIPLSPAVSITWDDFAVGVVGGSTLGAAVNPAVGGVIGSVTGPVAARGVRLHSMESVDDALAKRMGQINLLREQKGCN